MTIEFAITEIIVRRIAIELYGSEGLIMVCTITPLRMEGGVLTSELNRCRMVIVQGKLIVKLIGERTSKLIVVLRFLSSARSHYNSERQN